MNKSFCHAEPNGDIYYDEPIAKVDFMAIKKPMSIKRVADTTILDFCSSINAFSQNIAQEYYENY